VRQNSELLRALDELEKTCTTLKEENGLLRKSSAPETEEKVRRLRRKNTELSVLAKRLEERARKLQEANLRVVNRTNGISPNCFTSDCVRPRRDPDARERLIIKRRHPNHELSKKRKECENLEHEVKKRQKRCLDLVSNLLASEEGALREMMFSSLSCCQTRAENEELREDLSEVTAQHNSVLEENQRLRAKLENLEQVLKHMREVAERRQQLELEHEQALAILKFKQDEIKRLQRAQLYAKREHEGVVQVLESKVRDLEDKCRSQSEQFGLLSQELEKFRLQASAVDLAGASLLSNPSLSLLTNGVGPAELERSPVTKHRELPTISVSKSGSSSSKSETVHLTPKSDTHLMDTASEVEELDIDVAPAPYTASRGAAKLQVFIARYSYNPYDGPNDNPEVRASTHGWRIHAMCMATWTTDGFYEGKSMTDGRTERAGPSNFVERVSDDDVMSGHHPETGDASHNSLLDNSLHSASHQHHLQVGVSASERDRGLCRLWPCLRPPRIHHRPWLSQPHLTNGLDLDLEEVGVDIVPYPRKLTLIKAACQEHHHSAGTLRWCRPGGGNVWSYNVYVDQELRLKRALRCPNQSGAGAVGHKPQAYRVSVQSLTRRAPRTQLRCSMLVGRDVCVAPTQLRAERITATSAGRSSLCLNNLLPSLQYAVKVEARPHRTPMGVTRGATRTQERLHHLHHADGPPDAPSDVQLEHGPSPAIALIIRVTGYTIYADKKKGTNFKVLEVSCPTAGSALLGPSQMQSLLAAQELTLRTMSAHGESCDSLPVNVAHQAGRHHGGSSYLPPHLCNPNPAHLQAAAPLLIKGFTYQINWIVCFSLLTYVIAEVTAEGLWSLPGEYHADNSRSDLSDILEEEEEDFYSDHLGDRAGARGYIFRANRVKQRVHCMFCDSDEEVLERILKLPAQVQAAQELFIIPEVTEEEDSSQEELSTQPWPRSGHRGPRELGTFSPRPPASLQPTPTLPPLTITTTTGSPRSLTKEPLLRQVKVPQAGGPAVLTQLTPTKERSLLRGLGDRLRREAMLRSQMAVAAAADPGHGPKPAKTLPGQQNGAGSEAAYRDGDIRIFVALFPYDPASMSPNPDAAEEELPFTEGQIIKVYGDKDADGFYRGECAGHLGYVPCNMTRQQLLRQGFLSTLPRRPVPPPKPRRSKKGVSPAMGIPAPGARKMVAIFDYDPRESSPNTDIEAELTFSAGDIIHVFGDMDEDGFFYGDLNGHSGLVPSNFLQAVPEDAPAKALSAQPAPEPRRESQVA
uniref:TSPO associated protein 1 n=1 Tax=Cyclopterus lumpus TaxID=8103 RepID=A0A8C2ZDH7_CYCLU